MKFKEKEDLLESDVGKQICTKFFRLANEIREDYQKNLETTWE